MTEQRSKATRIVATAAAVLVAVGVLSFAAPGTAAAAGPREPVIFVHGWNSSPSTWNTMVTNFKNAGYRSDELFAWGYNTSQSNVTTAAQFGVFVDQVRAQTGAAKVDVISHSMGGLSTRYCIKFGSCANKVDDWVSLAGPNHGTLISGLCSLFIASCRDMATGSSFLANLNAGDETPGTLVSWSTWRSPWCDGVIWPTSSTSLSGADNFTTGCILHSSLTTNTTVFNQVFARVND